MLGWYEDKFWEKYNDSENIDCTRDEMRQAVDGFIGVESALLNNPAIVTVANMVSFYL